MITPVPEDIAALHGEGPGGGLGGPLWGIVDCARDESLYPDVAAMGDDAVCLFAGPLHQPVRAAAPYLLRLREGAPFLRRWRDEGLGEHWGIFFRSDEDQETLRRHFRTKLMVRLPDGRKVLFRFYDPRVMGSLPTFFCRFVRHSMTRG